MLSLNTLRKKYSDWANQKDLEVLLAAIINQPRVFLLSHSEYCPNIFARIKLAYFLYLYKKGYSIAAILKHKEFFGLDFYVNKHVLIPRPDTEIMVEAVIKKIAECKQKILLIDVGTGSGCIPISIIKTLNHESIKAVAIDISRQALQVAKKNAKKHNLKIKFLHGDLLLPLLNCHTELVSVSSNYFNQKKILKQVQYDISIITANLPYLTNDQFKSELSIQKEPQLALISDRKNGLEIYERLLEQTKNLLLNCYIAKLLVFLEIDPRQAEIIKSLIKEYLPQAKIEIKKDLSGLDRLVEIEIIKN